MVGGSRYSDREPLPQKYEPSDFPIFIPVAFIMILVYFAGMNIIGGGRL